MSGQSGYGARYERSVGGLVGALIVILALIVGFVVFRSLFRDNQPTPVEAVDYASVVDDASELGLRVAHARELPRGWRATSVDLRVGEPPAWGVGVLTDTGSFVGLRQEDSSLASLVETYVDEDAEEQAPVTLDGPLAAEFGTEWEHWTDDGGDHAYALDLGDLGWLLVYGSAGESVVREFAADLAMTTPAAGR